MAYSLSITALIFLCTGITLAVLSIDEKNPDNKCRWNISARWVEISFFDNFRILDGRVFGLVESKDKAK